MIILKKQLGFVLPVAILIVVVFIAAGGAGYYFYKMKYKYSSPEKTFSLLIKTAEEGDIDAYLECWTEESQEILKPGLGPEGLAVSTMRLKEGGFEVTEKTAERAVITLVEGGVLIFKKEKGNWKIDFKETLVGKEEELSEEEEKEEAKRLINEALLKIEMAKSEEDLEKLQYFIGPAVESATKATELDPGNPKIWFERGNIYFEIEKLGAMGAKDWAIHCYKKALELEPTNPLYQEKLREIQR